jgi:hypothetical protein
VRTVAVVALLGLVLTASALDLALGVLWVVALVAVLLLRRRIRLAAVLVLLATAALLVWGGRLGWFASPIPVSYERGWVPAWGEPRAPFSTAGAAGDPQLLAARARLDELKRDELRLTGSELEQRAGAVIALSRRLDPLRGDAPREAAAVEAAARRLARTLAAVEFRDLEARRAAASAYLVELDRRLGTARDGSEAASVLRAADPAAMAHVSLRPVREDLAAASAAVDALVRVLGGGVPTAATTATARYDDSRKELRREVRYAVTGAPGVRLLRVELRAFRGAAPSGAPVSLAYAAGGEATRPVPPGASIDLEPAPRGVAIVRAWAEPAAPRPVHATFRPLAFEQLEVGAASPGDDVLITVALDGRAGIEIPLAVQLRPPRLARVVVPRYALYFASQPGTVTPDPEGESWEPAGEGSGPLRIELVPRALLLRNPAFAWVRGYLYRPNPGTVVVATGLAALALVLVRRSRPTGAEGG